MDRGWDNEAFEDGQDRETYEAGWFENSNGNHVWWIDGAARATVYSTDNDMWAAIWNGASDGRARRLKQRFDDADDAMAAVEEADAEGEDSPLWLPPASAGWIKNKKGEGFHRRVDGTVFSVKQAKSGSWFAASVDGLIGQNGTAKWFRKVEDARRAVDEFADGDGGWRLVDGR